MYSLTELFDSFTDMLNYVQGAERFYISMNKKFEYDLYFTGSKIKIKVTVYGERRLY